MPRKTNTVSFNVSDLEAEIISRIMDRACRRSDPNVMPLVAPRDRLNVEMSITACHANGNKLDLERLLMADDFNFAHDVLGIDRHVSRETGQLTNFFSPRFSA